MLISRRLWHIFQHTKTLLYRTLPLRRKLLPLRQHFILNVILLLRRQLVPVPRALLHLLPLAGIQLLIVLVVLQRSLFLLRTQIVEIPSRRRVRRRRTVLLIPRARRRPIRIRSLGSLRSRRAIRVILTPLVPPFRLPLLSPFLLSLLPLLRLRFRRTILRCRRKRYHHADSDRQPNSELEFSAHLSSLHLLRLLLWHIVIIVIRRRLRQI